MVPFYPAATSCGFCFQSVEMPKARKVGPPQQFQKEMVFATHFLQVVSSGDHYLVDDFFFSTRLLVVFFSSKLPDETNLTAQNSCSVWKTLIVFLPF